MFKRSKPLAQTLGEGASVVIVLCVLAIMVAVVAGVSLRVFDWLAP